jgi:hypothetical protein
VQRAQEQRGACEGSKKKVPACDGLAGGDVKDLNQELRFVLDFFRAASSTAAGLGQGTRGFRFGASAVTGRGEGEKEKDT